MFYPRGIGKFLPVIRNRSLETAAAAGQGIHLQIVTKQRKWLRIAEESFEAVVHVLLDVAMEEGETRLIGSEVDDGAAVVGHNHSVFDEAGGGFVVDRAELPQVPMHVHGVRIIGPVTHHEAVA
jgi:hypothetical protein